MLLVIVKNQWKQLGYHREYVIKLTSALNLLSEGKNRHAQLAWRNFLDYIRRSEMSVQQNLDVYRVIEVAKNYTGFLL